MNQDIDVRSYFREHSPSTAPKGMTGRVIDAVTRAGIGTMRALCDASPEELRRVRNLGEKGLELALLMRDKYATEK